MLGGRVMSYGCVEAGCWGDINPTKGRMTHFLCCVIQPFSFSSTVSTRQSEEQTRGRAAEVTWSLGQILQEGVADSFLWERLYFFSGCVKTRQRQQQQKKLESFLPPRVLFGWAQHMFQFDCDLLYLLQLWGGGWLQRFVFWAISKFFKPNTGIIEHYMSRWHQR